MKNQFEVPNSGSKNSDFEFGCEIRSSGTFHSIRLVELAWMECSTILPDDFFASKLNCYIKNTDFASLLSVCPGFYNVLKCLQRLASSGRLLGMHSLNHGDHSQLRGRPQMLLLQLQHRAEVFFGIFCDSFLLCSPRTPTGSTKLKKIRRKRRFGSVLFNYRDICSN